MTSENKQHPPREWFEENFVYNDENEPYIIYCSCCNIIPFTFIGHLCTSWEMGADAATKIKAPYHWDDVKPIENDDRPGNWSLQYQPHKPLGETSTKQKETNEQISD